MSCFLGLFLVKVHSLQCQTLTHHAVVLADVNGYSATFDGANLENAQFENAILTGMPKGTVILIVFLF